METKKFNTGLHFVWDVQNNLSYKEVLPTFIKYWPANSSDGNTRYLSVEVVCHDRSMTYNVSNRDLFEKSEYRYQSYMRALPKSFWKKERELIEKGIDTPSSLLKKPETSIWTKYDYYITSFSEKFLDNNYTRLIKFKICPKDNSQLKGLKEDILKYFPGAIVNIKSKKAEISASSSTDAFGNQVNVGDEVVVSNTCGILSKGKVSRITEKYFLLENDNVRYNKCSIMKIK